MIEARQQGKCLCGSTRFAAKGRPLITMACHCRGCQRLTGSAFSLSSLYGADAFEVTEGEPVLGGLKGPHRQYFCPSCMSWLFTRPAGMEDYVNVRSTMFDDPTAHRPYMEAHLREGLPGIEINAVERFETVPEEDRFGPLIAAYAQWRGAAEEERA